MLRTSGALGNPLSAPIPAQPLAAALAALTEHTGLQLVYVSSLAEQRTSHEVPAGLAPREALTRLLQGTGLDAEFLNDRTARLFAHTVDNAPPGRPAPAASQGLPGSSALQDIYVTATKRQERLDQIPLSAIVWSREELLELDIDTMADLAAISPGVEYDFNAQWGPGVLTNVAIRGIDSKVGASTTGIYLDDAPIQARNDNFGNPYPVTFDLQRIEILKGPQSMLFGAGAEGGAIRYIPTEPNTTAYDSLYRASLEDTHYGTLSYEAGAAVGAPLIDEVLGARVSAWYRTDGGYVDHVDPFTAASVDAHSNHASTQAFRLSFAIEPESTLRIVPALAYQSHQVSDTPVFYESLSNPSQGVLDNGKLLRQPAEDHFGHASLKVDAQFPALTLTAETSYFDRREDATVDTTNEAGALYYGGFGNPLGDTYPTSYAQAVSSQMSLHQIDFSQEIRLTSKDRGGPIAWDGGVFFSQAHQVEIENTYSILVPTVPGVFVDDKTYDSSLSAFGQVAVKWTPSLHTSIGTRVDHIRSDYWRWGYGFAYTGGPPLSYGSRTATPVTPSFDVDYQLDDHDLIYGKVAEGYRIGGINPAFPIACEGEGFVKSYGSDSLWSYEIGSKGKLFDNRIEFDVSAFLLRWNNVQDHEVPACGDGFVANTGTAIGKGFDLHVAAVIVDGLVVGLTVENVDVRYSSNVDLDGQVIVERGAVVGGVPHVPPPWMGTLDLRAQWPLARGIDAFARAEEIVHSHNPGPFSELNPASISYSPLYTADPATYLLNLQFGLTWRQATIKLYLDNAFDSLPLLQRNADTGTSTLIYAYTFRPRTLGLNLAWKY